MEVKRALGESINKLTTANQSAGWVPVITRSFHNIGSHLLGRDCSDGRENRGRKNLQKTCWSCEKHANRSKCRSHYTTLQCTLVQEQGGSMCICIARKLLAIKGILAICVADSVKLHLTALTSNF